METGRALVWLAFVIADTAGKVSCAEHVTEACVYFDNDAPGLVV